MKSYIIVVAVLVALALAGAIRTGAFETDQATAATPIVDTVVNVEPWTNPNGDRLAAIRPDAWRQEAYFIWVSGACAATLHLGDAWPSQNPACEVSH